MTLHYAYFCDDCGSSSREAVDVCESCGSKDITHAPTFASVDFDDVADARRLDEIRTNNLATEKAHAALDQLIEIARGVEQPYSQPGFLRRRQAGGR